MNEYFTKFINIFVFLVLTYIGEQFVCFIIIKKKNKHNEYLDYKQNHKGLIQFSNFLYKDKRKSLIIKSLILIIIFLCSFGHKEIYYDRYKNEYHNKYDVIYYDESGNQYKLCKDSNKLMNISNSITNYYDLDEKGFVVDSSKLDLYCSQYIGISYTENKSGIYYFASCIYWDENGLMYYQDLNNKFYLDSIHEMI